MPKGIDERVRADGTTSYRVRKQWQGGRVNEEFATLDEAERYLLDLNQKIRAGRYREPSKLTVAEWVAQYIERNRTRWQGGTHEVHERVWRLRIRDAPLGRMPLADLELRDIQQWVDSMTVGAKSVRLAGATLSGALREAARHGIIPVSPASGVSYPRAARHIVNPWTRDEVRQVHASVEPDPRLRAFYRIMLSLGLRSGEVRAIQWADVRGVRLHIHRTATHYGIREGTKRGAGRIVSLSPMVMQSLDAWREVGTPDSLIFPSIHGGAATDETVRYWHNQTCKRAGVRQIRLHDLRHTAATMMMDAGVPLTVASRILGHASTSITADLYQWVDQDMQDRALERVDAWVGEDT